MVTISFFFNDTATTEIYTLSLHDALPISDRRGRRRAVRRPEPGPPRKRRQGTARRTAGHPGKDDRRPPRRQPDAAQVRAGDRKSTRLNSSHANISYAVFCLKKKKQSNNTQ